MGEPQGTPEAPNDPGTPGSSATIIVGVRVLILIAAAAAAIAAVTVAVRTARKESDRARAEARYVCPMHPEVRSDGPGECPICRMALEPVSHGPASGGKAMSMSMMADVTAVENIRKHNIVEFVRKRSLLPNLRELRGAASVGDDGVITAVMYDDQIFVLTADDIGTFSLAASPQIAYAVHRTDDPAVSWDRSTSKVRFRVVEAATATATAGAKGAGPSPPALRPGQVGWLDLPHRVREVLGVPTSALLQSPEGPYVLALNSSRRFEKRPIKIGETFVKQGFAVVLSGLNPKDRVVSRAAFFVDADRRLGNHVEDGTWGAP